MKGLILTEMNRPTDAIAVFHQADRRLPELQAYNNLAVLYAQQKRYDKARTALEMAIRTHRRMPSRTKTSVTFTPSWPCQAYDKALQLDCRTQQPRQAVADSRVDQHQRARPGTIADGRRCEASRTR